MPDYDKERALQEEIAGLGDIVTALRKRARALQIMYTEAEVEFNAVNKLLGFAQVVQAGKREALVEIQKAKG